MTRAPATPVVRSYTRGEFPLDARLAPWTERLAADPARCAGLLAEHGSPVNVLHTRAFARNGGDLIAAGAARGVRVRPFYARKANKALAFVDAARDAGFGVDVASHAELAQVLDSGVPGADVVLSAAVKDADLLDLALSSGTVVSLDSRQEWVDVQDAARRTGARPRVCPRLAVDPALVAPTRFGERLDVWRSLIAELVAAAHVDGVHVHLHGYAAADRVAALDETLELVDCLVEAGARPSFVDLGGGVPMSYLEDEDQWHAFWRGYEERRSAVDVSGAAPGPVDPGPGGEPLTWKNRPLGSVYPFWQRPVRGEWLGALLDAPLRGRPGEESPARAVAAGGDAPGTTAAEALATRGLELRLEPGRSLLDECGTTLARVVATKRRSDGVGLVSVAMNRTQCRTTSDDFLVDPLLVPAGPRSTEVAPFRGFLVGAYCIEDEILLARPLDFPHGVVPGDVVVLPNTAGYFMHIVESASHQLPLARNVVLDETGVATIDRIDQR